MKFLFLVTGLGEAAQGTAVALYARTKGTDIKFVSTTDQCHDHIAAFGFEDILYSEELSTPGFETMLTGSSKTILLM